MHCKPAFEGGFMLPNDQFPPLPGGPWSGLGILGAVLTGGFLWLRKFLSRDAVERAGDDAYKSAIDMLSKQLGQANARADAAESRADKERERANQLMAALDKSSQQISQLNSKVSELTGQVRRLEAQVASLSGKPK